MIIAGISAPDAFTTILAAIAGALAGIVTPLQAPPTTGAETAATEGTRTRRISSQSPAAPEAGTDHM